MTLYWVEHCFAKSFKYEPLKWTNTFLIKIFPEKKPVCRKLTEELEDKREDILDMDLCMICGMQVADLLVHMQTSHQNEEVAFHLYSG